MSVSLIQWQNITLFLQQNVKISNSAYVTLRNKIHHPELIRNPVIVDDSEFAEEICLFFLAKAFPLKIIIYFYIISNSIKNRIIKYAVYTK